MKKNYNIEEIERWAQKGFSDAEKHLRYEAKRVPYAGAEKAAAARAKERGGARFSPALKIAGAFLALVLTGGAMFGGLKFLEYKGAQNLAEQGSGTPGTSQDSDTPGTSQGEKTPGADNNISNADEAPAVEPVEYDPNDEHGAKFVYVNSGDKVYQPFVCSESLMAVIRYKPPEFAYSGKLDIVNNVKDRDWTLLRANISFPGIESYDRTFDGMDINQICDYIDDYSREWYRVYLKVTWDDPDDENAVIYYVDFVIKRAAANDKFENVVKFDIDYTDYGVPQVSELPSDVTHIRIFGKLKCEAAEALGYSVCMYDAAPVEVSMSYLTPCILDNNGEIMFDFQQSSDVWYAGKTPTGHPTFFYVKRHALTSNGWTYADLYAYDTVNKEETLVISVGPEGLHSQSNLRVFGDISYNEETKDLNIGFYEDKTNIYNPIDKATWSEPFATQPIKWNGEKYVVEGIDAMRFSEKFANANKTEEEIKREQLKAKTEEEAAGRLYVTASGTKYYPALTRAEIFADNNVYQFEYDNVLPVIEYAEPFEVSNEIRTTWETEISIDKIGFTDTEDLVKYLHGYNKGYTEDVYTNVVINIRWGEEEDSYMYGFTLHIKAEDNYAKFTVAAGKNAIAPYEYKEYDKVEVNEVNVTVNPAPDVIPVIDVYALGEYETIKYSYDTEAVTHVETRMGAYGGGTVLYSSPGSILADARSMLRIPGASNVLYVESVFQKKDGSGKYISYIFAVSGGEPACYPFSSDGDGAARFTVSDDNNTYAPRAKYFYCSDRSVIENSRFTELNLPYYNVPTVVLTGSLEFKMKDGYRISKVIAFKDTKETEQKIYHGIEGLHLSTWLSKQPWGEFYAAVIVDKDGEESDEGNGYLTAYVFRVVLASPSSNPETVEQIQTFDHSAQIEELQSWLSQRMWNGMNESELLNTAVKGKDKDLKNAIMAVVYDQFDLEDDGTFVRYKTEYCDFLYFAEKDTFRIREARLILYPGTSFSLPFGITLDMSPEEALSAMGYTGEEAASLNGVTVNDGGYGVSYNNGFLNITFVYNDVCLGIELGGGSQAQAYIEMG